MKTKIIRKTLQQLDGSRGRLDSTAAGGEELEESEFVLEATIIEIKDVSYQNIDHSAFKGDNIETHFNLKIVSPKFHHQTLVKLHRMVYDALGDELCPELHALSIVSKTLRKEEVVDATPINYRGCILLLLMFLLISLLISFDICYG
eukprot:XP_015579901.1 sufE-like protein 1, chloroplastic/mitochondrial [Ricinus communis]